MDNDETETPSHAVSTDFFKLSISMPKFHIYGDETIKPNRMCASEIIERVARDVTVMRNADVVGPSTSVARNIKTPSIPMTSFAVVMDNSGRRCEMQTVTDTEMIDAADGAEAVLQMINNKGMTQLFDVSFNSKVNIRKERPLGALCSKNNNTDMEKDFYQVLKKDLMELERNEEDGTLDTIVTHDRSVHVNKESKKIMQNSLTGGVEEEIIGIYKDAQISGVKNTDLLIKERNTDTENGNTFSSEERTGNISELMIENIRPPSPVLVPTIKFMKSKTAKDKRKLYSLEAFEEIETSFNKRFKTQEYSVPDEKTCSLRVNKSSDEAENILNDNINIDALFSSDEEGYLSQSKSLSVNYLEKSLQSIHSDVIVKCMPKTPSQNANSSDKELEQKIQDQVRETNFKNGFEEHGHTIENTDKQTMQNVKSSLHIQQPNFNIDNEFDTTLQEFNVHFDENNKQSCNVYNNEFPEKVLHEMENNNNLELMEIKKDNSVSLAINNSTIIENGNNEPSYKDVIEEMKEFLGFTSSSNKSVITPIMNLVNAQKTQNDTDSKNCQTRYQRFTTGSNKNIVFLKEALTKTKTLFQDLEETYLENKTIENDSSNSVSFHKLDKFISTGKKSMPIPENTLDKTKSKYVEGFTVDEEFVDSESKECECEPQFRGFTTASDTNEALEKLKYIIQDIKEVSINEDIVESERHECRQSFKEFITASSKNNEVFEEVQAKSKNQDAENISIQDRFIQSDDKRQFHEFTTNTNKNINVSEDALTQTKNLFHDIECEMKDNFILNEDLKPLPKSQEFTTASNKNVTVSEYTINRVENILQDIGETPIEEDFIQHEGSKVNLTPKFKGFTTANNKNIVPEQAKITNSFQNIEELSSDKENYVHKFEPSQKPQEFTTTIKKHIKVSEGEINKIKNQDIEEIATDHSIVQHQVIKSSHLKQFQAKTKNLFQDIEEIIYQDNFCETENKKFIFPKFQGFTTASNKNIQVSEQALAKTKSLFHDIVDLPTKDKTDKIKFEPPPKLQGFTTASNKSIKISEQALIKTKALFQDIEDLPTEDKTDDQKAKTPSKYKRFSTASNKNIEVSEQALAKTKPLFHDIVDFPTEDKAEDHKFEPPLKFQGFTTASNKSIKISEQALVKTKALFHDIEDLPTEDKTDNQKAKTPSKCKRFSTASNKNIEVSEQALAKTKSLFHDIVDFPTEDKAEDHKFEPPLKFQGFTTASNKSIKISEQALVKTKALFHDIEDLPTEDKTDDQKAKTPPKFQGFTTGSNKHCRVTQEALSKTKHIFQDIENIPKKCEINEDILHTEFDPATKFQVFTTGNNNIITVSEESLAKTKNLFQDFNNVTTSTFGAFNTVNNKDIVISEEAIVMRKDVFKNNEGKLEKKITFEGFSTGNKNIIKVSEAALEITKNLFNNIEFSQTSDKESDTSNATKPDKPEMKDNCDDLLNTQIQHHFEETMYTEDFCKTPENIMRSKKSGSPILQMSAKKRKIFKVPYRINSKISTISKKAESLAKIDTKSNFIYTFDDNYKCITERVSLKKLKYVENQTTEHHFDFDNVSNFKFITNDVTNSSMSTDILKNIFLNSVDRKIIPEGWLDNHIKFIIWKLISYELKFPEHFCRVVSPKNLLDQLKYRYDRELYKVERPALRKILERDETPGRCMVLCVVRILSDGAASESATNTMELEVTDGWYCIRATIDKLLSKAVSDGKIVSGTKIITHGAELTGCDQGIAPWEDTSSVRIKLHGNSTRRVRWHTRLGLQPVSTVAVGLQSLTPEGGKVSKVRLFVARVYPLLYVEKFEDGSTVTRSERLESIQAAKHENDRLARLDSIYQELEREMHMSEDSQGLTATLSRARGGEAENLTESQFDQLNRRSSKKRDEVLEEIQKRLEEKIKRCGLDKMQRNVVPLLKIRVCTWNALPSRSHYEKDSTNLKPNPENYEKGSINLKISPVNCGIGSMNLTTRPENYEKGPMNFKQSPENYEKGPLNSKPNPEIYGKGSINFKQSPLNYEKGSINSKPNPESYGKVSMNVKSCEGQKYEKLELTKACMAVWKPSDNLLDVIKEGVWIDGMNVFPTAVRMSELHISAGRQSIFNRVRNQNNEFSRIADSVARKCANIKDLREMTYSPFQEVDLVGLIVQIDPKTSDFEKIPYRNQNTQNVYLCDAEKNLVSVHFWGGLKKFGFDKVIETKQFVLCSNLQVRMGNSRKSIPQFRVTEFSLFTKIPKNLNSKSALETLKKEFENVDLDTFCNECIGNKTEAPQNDSPYRFNNRTEYNLSKHKIFIDSPCAQKLKNDINLTGLDFDSTFKLDSQLAETEALRKSKIRLKIEKLKMYGEPPPLSPMHIINKSSRVKKTFISPILNKSNSVAVEDNVASKNAEICTSPVLKSQMKRPNPVKTDFSKDVASSSNACDNVAIVATEVTEKEFLEEFEYSPPLSLDSKDL